MSFECEGSVYIMMRILSFSLKTTYLGGDEKTNQHKRTGYHDLLS
jgi:hypothetical protein